MGLNNKKCAEGVFPLFTKVFCTVCLKVFGNSTLYIKLRGEEIVTSIWLFYQPETNKFLFALTITNEEMTDFIHDI